MEKVGMALKRLVLSIVVYATVACGNASAATFNGSFEGENPFEGWVVSEDAVAFGNLYQKTGSILTMQGVSLLPTDGSSVALFESFDPLTTISVVLPGPGVVSFDVAFISNDDVHVSFHMNSRGRATLGNEVLFEAETFAVGLGANGGGNFIDWHTIIAQVPVGGATLVFSQEVVSGTGLPSNTVFDNVQFKATTVPLPGGLPLLAGALGVIGIVRRFSK